MTIPVDDERPEEKGDGSDVEKSGSMKSQVPRKAPSNQKAASAAADLIKTLDSAFASMNQNAVAAARDAEEARRNARTASELARLYQHQSIQKPSKHWPYSYQEHGELRQPTTPASTSFIGSNGTHTPFTPNSSSTPYAKTDKTKGPLSPAEDLLSLSLELERSKQALSDERAMHEETKAELEKSRKKAMDYENQMDEMFSNQETERQKYDNRVQELETDIKTSNRRVDMAEADAQEALNLARANVASREQVEEWLQHALKEVETLRARIVQQQEYHLQQHSTDSIGSKIFTEDNGQAHPSSLESIAEEDTSDTSSSPARPGRALVAAGRQILQRNQAMTVVTSPLDAAERRRRLKERMNSLSANVDRPSPPMNQKPQQHHHLGTSVEALDICRRTTRILKESAKRLRLSGRWWTGMSLRGPAELQLDTMARHYCHEIEVS